MTYTTGSIVTKGEYNTFVAGSADGTYNPSVPNLGIIWGTGFGRYGYGQNLSFITPVSTGQVIAAQDWDNLDAIISNVVDHQLGPGNYLSGSPVMPGQLITTISRLAPGIQLAYGGVGKCFAPSESNYSTQFSGAWGGTGRRKLRVTQTLTFNTADHARWFFNAGGKLKLTFDFTPNPLNLQSAVWENITQSAGAVTIGYQATTRVGGSSYDGSYIIPANADGFWSQTSGVTKEHFRQLPNPFGRYYDLDYDGIRGYYGYRGPYGYYESAGDYLKVEMLVTDSNGLNNNLGKTVSVITTLVNAEDAFSPAGDTIQGTFRVNLAVSKPTTDYLPVDNYSAFTFSGTADPTA
jgi:hypothetical protein